MFLALANLLIQIAIPLMPPSLLICHFLLNSVQGNSHLKCLQDFSFIFEKQQNLYEVQRYVTGLDKNLIKNVEFFDLYESKDLGDSSKSVTFRVTIQSKEKTLEEKDLEQLHKNILEKVSNKFKAKIRT